MKLAVISFTEQGNQLNKVLSKQLLELGEVCNGYVLNRFFNPSYEQAGLVPVKESLTEWTKGQFEQMDGIIFIGATGIAVRAIAPFLKDKMTDPAVVAMDELGRFSISLISGHVGGANDLALMVSRIIGAVPVITTATDINGRFAVDVFAKNHNLMITDRELAKKISADVLEDVPVGFFSDYPIEGNIPMGFRQEETCKNNLWITCRNQVAEDSRVLKLIPKTLILGIGCKKDTKKAVIKERVEAVLNEANLSLFGIDKIVSIDLKKKEPGLIAYAEELGVEFCTYPADELKLVRGEYTESGFVAGITGVGNVCERAAMASVLQAGGGSLLVKKQAGEGVTVAVAEKTWKVMI